ncbi:expansin EXLX1 family cellulose-binding protein [Micromonospora sp. NBC_01699]|uniref:expansin EXLX1 family cellulose-binding protein n=1 Tax=Micromonospora sp. NBC_01699 TaxID=2975984 RepID=UPI002E2F7F82|nr:expansin EXLX1 family cellulose-binding protein [Micromonospora sp. NBC_01699]
MTDPDAAPDHGNPLGDDGTGRRGGHRRATRAPIRWLTAAGITGVAAVLGIVLAVRSGAEPACAAALAAPPTGNTVHSGKATFYDSAGAGGNCSFPSAPADRLYVALGPSEYASAAACGGYLDVTGPKGRVRVVIMDQCPECAPGHIDLSREAFARIADPVQGVVPVSYRAVVNPPSSGPLTFRMKDGTSQWWFAVQVGNHGNPLRSVEAKGTGGGFRTAGRQNYNYWIVDGGLGAGPYSIRVTDVYGRQATATNIRLAPEQVQRSTVTMSGAAAPAAGARTPTPARSPSTRPTPSAAPTAAVSEPNEPASTVEALVEPPGAAPGC